MLVRAIDSVYRQTLQPDELIIIDDGSSDQTAAQIKRRYRQAHYYYQSARGISAARNNGIRQSSADWLAFLDDDDEWLPNKLQKQVEHIIRFPATRLIHTNELWIKNNRPLKQMQRHQRHSGKIFRHCLPLCCISPSSVIIHRTVFDCVGMFDEALPACEDYDMWLRICAVYPVHLIQDVLVKKYGGHHDQLSKKYWGMDRFRILALEKILLGNSLEKADYNAAVNTLLDKTYIYLNGAKKHRNTRHTAHFSALRSVYER